MRLMRWWSVALLLLMGAGGVLAQTVQLVESEDPASAALAGPLIPEASIFIRASLAADPDATQIDTVVVTVFTGAVFPPPAGQDSETVLLRETDINTNVFTGEVQSHLGTIGAVQNNGQFEIRGRGITPLIDVRLLAVQNIGGPITVQTGINGVLAVAPNPVLPGNVLTITVTDADALADEHLGPGNDTVKVTITSFTGINGTGIAFDQETLDVPERSAPAFAVGGTFLQSLRTAYAGAPAFNDNLLNLVNGGSIRTAYSDDLQTTGAVDVPVEFNAIAGNLVQLSAVAPTITLARSEDPASLALPIGTAIQPEHAIFVRVVDANSNVTPGTDTVTVTIFTGAVFPAPAGQDSEIVLLRETDANSGVFTGTVDTVTSLPGATQLNAQLEIRGRVITPSVTTRYQSPLNGAVATTAAQPVQVGITGVPALAPNPIQPGAVLTATVIDGDVLADQHLGPGNDTVRVTLTSFTGISGTGTRIDEETLDVPELGSPVVAVGGQFSQSIRALFSGVAVNNDGFLNVAAGGSVRTAYSDSLLVTGDVDQVIEFNSPAGNTVLFAAAAPAVVLITSDDPNSGLLPLATQLTPGDEVFVRVTDANANLTPGTDTVTVTAFTGAVFPAPLGQDTEIVLLRETDSPGVFTGHIDTRASFASALPLNGQLDIRGRGIATQVSVRYQFPGNGATATTAAQPVQPGVDAALTATPNPLVPGNRLTININDNDVGSNLHLGPGNDTVRVTITSFLGAARLDEETFEVPELGSPAAGAAGGQFFATVPVQFAGLAANNDGNVTVQAGGTLRVEYVDPLRANGDVDFPVAEVVITTAFASIVPTLRIASSEEPTAPTVAQIEPGNTLFFQVVDPDSNLTSDTDTVSLTAISGGVFPAPAGQDSELVLLRETAPASGIFTGHVETRFSVRGAFPNNGILEARGLNITALAGGRYQSFNGIVAGPVTVTVEPGVNGVITMNPNPLGPGQRIAINVIDTDVAANQRNGPGDDTVKVTITSRATPGGAIIDQETFDVQEIAGGIAGNFTGSLRTAFNFSVFNGVANDGTVTVANGGTVQASYVDALRVTGAIDVVIQTAEQPVASLAVPGQPAINFVTTLAGQPPLATGPIEPGDTVYVEVLDANSNLTEETDTVTVTVVTGAGGAGQDSEIVLLRETTPTSGRFTGSIDSRSSPTGAVPQNGQLDVRGRGPITPNITASFDPPPAGGAVISTGALAVNVGTNAIVAVTPGVVNPGTPLTITITDTDNVASRHLGQGNDTVTVTVSSFTLAGGGGALVDEETVEIPELGGVAAAAAGTFTGQIPVTFALPGANNDGRLSVVAGGSIRTAYADNLRVNGDVDTVQEFNAPAGNTVAFATVAPTLRIAASEDPAAITVAQIEPGHTVFIQLTDQDANLTPDADVVSVAVFSGGVFPAPAGQDSELVLLRETGPDTGLFTGHVETRFSVRGAFVANGIVEARGVGITPLVGVRYQSINTLVAGPVTVTVEPGVDGTITLNPSPVGPGQRLQIAVVDTDVAANQRFGPGDDTVKVTITSRRTPGGVIIDQETIDLQEIAGGIAGNFTGAIRTRFSFVNATGTFNDGIVQLQSGGTVQASYVDALRANGQIDVVIQTAEQNANPLVIPGQPTINFVTTLAGQPPLATGPIDPGDTVYVEVVDANSNLSEETDTVTVTIFTGNGLAGQDQEVILLRETTPDSGRFTGSIDTKFTPTGAALLDGQLDARGRGITPTITASYVNPATGLGVDTPVPLPVRAGVDAAAPTVAPAGNITPGTVLTITVTDDDRAANVHLGPGNDTARVTVTSRDAAGVVIDEENLDAGELASGATGIFVAKAATAFSYVSPGAAGLAGNQNDRVVQVVNGGSIRVAYTDPLRANGDIEIPVQTANQVVGTLAVNPSLLFRDGLDGGTPLTTIEPGDIVFVRVEDPNANLTSVRDTVSVSITAGAGAAQDQESLVLQETQPRSGVFTGFIRTKLGANEITAGIDVQIVRGNGQLEVRGRDTVTGTYASPSVFPTNAVVPVLVHLNGVIRFVQNSGASTPGQERFLRAGDSLFLQVIDDDANTSAVADRLTVTVRSRDAAGNAFDAVTVELVESGISTGIFVMAPGSRADNVAAVGDIVNGTQAGLRTEDRADRLAIPNDGILQVVGASRVTAEFNDAARPAGVGITRVSEELIVQPVVGLVADVRIRIVPGVSINPGTDQIVGGEDFCVEVADPNANRTGRVDTLQVTVVVSQQVGSATLDSETIQLTETGPDTGVFAGCIPTNFGPRVVGNGALTVAGNEVVTVSYTVVNRDGTTSTIFARATVAAQYSTRRTVSNLSGDGATIVLANGAQLNIPANALHRPAEINFQLFFGQTDIDAQPVDEQGNSIPAPLNPQVRLTRTAGRPYWYELQPGGLHFRRPAELAIPIPVDLQVLDPTSGQLRAVTDAEKTTQLRIVFFDGMDWLSVGGRFVGLGSGPDPAQSFIIGNINHLTTFALALDTRPPPFVGGPLITDVTLDNTTFTPNGDGANDATTLSFALAEPSTVTVRLYDSSGEPVRTLIQDVSFAPGFSSTQWDGSYLFAARKVPPGLYVFEIRASTVAGTRTARATIMVGLVK